MAAKKNPFQLKSIFGVTALSERRNSLKFSAELEAIFAVKNLFSKLWKRLGA
jgi:hypothetical protein